MHLQVAPAEDAMLSNPSGMADTRLRGRWLFIARALWGLLIALTLGVYVASASARFVGLQPSELAPDIVMLLAYTGIAAVIVWRRSDDWMALFVALFLVSWAATVSETTDVLLARPSIWSLPVGFSKGLGRISFFLFLYLFPNGRFVPRWTRPLAGVAIAFVVAVVGGVTLPELLGFGLWIGLLGSGVVAQIERYRRVSDLVQRQQTKWVVFGVTVMSIGFFIGALPGVLFPALREPGPQRELYESVSGLIAVCSILLLPLCLGIAILRYRLWDIDLLIHRTLVYGGLTVSVVGIYVLVVGYLSLLFQARGSPLIALLATGVVAVLFQPLREWLQRAVNRLLYGERDEPYTVISRLSRRLEATLASDAVLPTIVATIAQALKLPYAAITLQHDGIPTTVASCGSPQETPLRLPLVYQSEHVGDLLLAPRAPGEPLTPADRRLLDDLARQAGVVAHAVRLTHDLQRLTRDLQHAQIHLITAREEERRRLRRDLHDGIGSVLASLNLRAGAIRTLLARDPAAADALVVEQQQTIRGAIADIRRLVHELRPPALDELGIIGAIRERAAQYTMRSDSNRDLGTPSGLHVAVEAPDSLPALPAAVEVAAYRIVQEALTNVVRHAQARSCCVRLGIVDDALEIVVTDDGVGVNAVAHAGVGLMAMRERAAELGGTCVVERGAEGGTRVHARLPLPDV